MHSIHLYIKKNKITIKKEIFRMAVLNHFLKKNPGRMKMREIFEIDKSAVYKIGEAEIKGDILIQKFIKGLRYEEFSERLGGVINE